MEVSTCAPTSFIFDSPRFLLEDVSSLSASDERGLEEGPLVGVTQRSVIGNGGPGRVDGASQHRAPGRRA